MPMIGAWSVEDMQEREFLNCVCTTYNSWTKQTATQYEVIFKLFIFTTICAIKKWFILCILLWLVLTICGSSLVSLLGLLSVQTQI